MYNRKDHYYKKAKEEGFASRATYKFEQIETKYKVVKKGDHVLDLGCAPGGWLQILSRLVGPKGLVAGIDILPIKIQLPENVRFILGDINDDVAMGKVLEFFDPSAVSPSGHRIIDLVVSDMAPNTSGVAFKDCYLSYELCVSALDVAKKVLKEGGNFVTKIFQGQELNKFRLELKKNFEKVESYIPPATRQASKEQYLIGKGYLCHCSEQEVPS